MSRILFLDPPLLHVLHAALVNYVPLWVPPADLNSVWTVKKELRMRSVATGEAWKAENGVGLSLKLFDGELSWVKSWGLTLPTPESLTIKIVNLSIATSYSYKL